MKKRLLYLILLTAWMLPSFASAADTGTQKGESLDDIVITTSRVEETKKEVVQTLTIIDREEIEMSAADDLADLLAEKGVGHIHKYPSGNTSVGIRSFRTDTHGNDLKGNVLILLNGRRAGTGNLAKFMTKNIERIEIIRGPGAVQYGSAGMGGVINVITKQGSENFEGFIEAGYGSNNHKEQSVGLSGMVEGADYSAAVTRLDEGDYETGEGEDYYNTYIDDQINASINLGYEFAPSNRVGLIYNHFETQTGNYSSFTSNTANGDYAEKDNRSIDLIYDGATDTKQYIWRMRYFTGEDNNNYYYPDSGSSDSETKTEQNGAQAQITGDFDLAQLTLGTDWLNYDIGGTGTESEYDNFALFLLGKLRLSDNRLILTAGLRQDLYEISGADTDVSDDDLTLSLGAAYLFTENWKVRLSFGQAFVMPTAESMLMDVTYYGGYYVYEGNPDLKPERSSSYEAGVEYDANFINADLSVFYTDYEDKIVSQYVGLIGGSYTYTYVNVDEATISGIEGVVSFDIGGQMGLGLQIKPYVNFVYLTEYEDGETGEDLQYVSDLTLSAGLDIGKPDLFNVKFTLAHTGDQQVYDWSAGEEVTKKAFTVANLTARYKIYETANGNTFWLRGEIDNLFDRDYEYVVGYPMAGRTFFASLKFTF